MLSGPVQPKRRIVSRQGCYDRGRSHLAMATLGIRSKPRRSWNATTSVLVPRTIKWNSTTPRSRSHASAASIMRHPTPDCRVDGAQAT